MTTQSWIDIKPGTKYVGTGGGMRDYECVALYQKNTGFGHKYAYVVWTGEIPEGIEIDEKNGSYVRTNLLKELGMESVNPTP